MLNRLALITLAAIAACFLFWGAPFAAIERGVPEPAVPAPGKPAQQVPAERLSAPECVVAGTLLCSEYGSRFKDTLMLVLVDGRDRYTSSISDTDGSFALLVPCGRSYELRVEFKDKAMSIGRIALPDAADGTVYNLELRHTGSYLELVRDVRNGVKEDDIIYRLTVPKD